MFLHNSTLCRASSLSLQAEPHSNINMTKEVMKLDQTEKEPSH